MKKVIYILLIITTLISCIQKEDKIKSLEITNNVLIEEFKEQQNLHNQISKSIFDEMGRHSFRI